MHKISVPISLSEVNSKTLPIYLEDLRMENPPAKYLYRNLLLLEE